MLASTLLAVATLLPFSLPDMNAGKTMYKSEDHKNAVFVVETFFLGCPYCHQNAPNVQDVVEYYKTNPRVQVLDVGIDRLDGQYSAWMLAHKPTHPVLKDAARELIGKLGTRSYPSTYVIDCNGSLLETSSGLWNERTKLKLKAAIEKGLESNCSTEDPELQRRRRPWPRPRPRPRPRP